MNNMDTIKTTFGTSYFVSGEAAIKYYSECDPNPIQAVKRKLAEGSIHIGQPILKPGQTLSINREEGRYFITE